MFIIYLKESLAIRTFKVKIILMHSKISVVIPSFKVRAQILKVISEIGPEVSNIYIVDDACPEESGNFVASNCADTRVKIIHNEFNLGVGGAVVVGYLAAIRDGAEIIIKIDGDYQMDPALIPFFIAPIRDGRADYTKGNRFYDLSGLSGMPHLRILGNAILSFMTKLSAGYWGIFDPTNGYTAVHRKIVLNLPLEKISKRYFFETDMLFRLYILRAKVMDIPMRSKYGDEISNLRISSILGEFLYKHVKNFFKRIFYCYYLRDLSIASIELPIGAILFLFGILFGIFSWVQAFQNEISTPAGTIMLSALPTLMGLQLILSFLAYDISSTPSEAIHPILLESRDSV